MPADLQALTRALLEFRDERNWSQFHTLRNLIVSLNLEASELLEFTQWKDDRGLSDLLADEGKQEALRDECADILLYLLLIAEKTGFDLIEAGSEKLRKNALKYPIDKCFGSSRKYTELSGD